MALRRKKGPVDPDWKPREDLAAQQRARRQRSAIAADTHIPAEERVQAVIDAPKQKRPSKGSKRPPGISDRVWNIAGKFIDYGWEHREDLELDKDELKIRRDRLAQEIDKFINADEPTEFLALLQQKFRRTEDYIGALDWMLDKAIWVYWERWSKDEQGFHQVRFVEYLDGLLRRTYDLYQHHLWKDQGRPEMPKMVHGGTKAELDEIERQDGERRLISHFDGHYPGYGVKVEDDLLLALPEPTNEGDETQ